LAEHAEESLNNTEADEWQDPTKDWIDEQGYSTRKFEAKVKHKKLDIHGAHHGKWGHKGKALLKLTACQHGYSVGPIPCSISLSFQMSHREQPPLAFLFARTFISKPLLGFL
jgi:hypothetical protein